MLIRGCAMFGSQAGGVIRARVSPMGGLCNRRPMGCDSPVRLRYCALRQPAAALMRASRTDGTTSRSPASGPWVMAGWPTHGSHGRRKPVRDVG